MKVETGEQENTRQFLSFGERSFLRAYFHFLGWADDSQLPNKRQDSTEACKSGYAGGAFTTGRRGRTRVPLPALPPGKINLSDYNHVSAALGRLQVVIFRCFS